MSSIGTTRPLVLRGGRLSRPRTGPRGPSEGGRQEKLPGEQPGGGVSGSTGSIPVNPEMRPNFTEAVDSGLDGRREVNLQIVLKSRI